MACVMEISGSNVYPRVCQDVPRHGGAPGKRIVEPEEKVNRIRRAQDRGDVKQSGLQSEVAGSITPNNRVSGYLGGDEISFSKQHRPENVFEVRISLVDQG